MPTFGVCRRLVFVFLIPCYAVDIGKLSPDSQYYFEGGLLASSNAVVVSSSKRSSSSGSEFLYGLFMMEQPSIMLRKTLVTMSTVLFLGDAIAAPQLQVRHKTRVNSDIPHPTPRILSISLLLHSWRNAV